MSINNKYYVKGMHCAACEILIQDKLSKITGVYKVSAKLAEKCVYIESDRDISLDILNNKVNEFGYQISNENINGTKPNMQILFKGFLFSSIIFSLFLFIQNLGIGVANSPEFINLPFIFLIGFIASLSTCMAVVGGLVLSISSTSSLNNKKSPIIVFHISRLISFLILGGVIGLLGKTVNISSTGFLVMNVVLLLVMLITGLNLLSIFDFTRKFQVRMPKFIGTKLLNTNKDKDILYALVAGVSTFFLPCGFTQSMQVYSLTTNSFIQSALTMFVFALGTLPVLSLVSFVSIKLRSQLFYTTSGFLVIIFALYTFVNSLHGLGII